MLRLDVMYSSITIIFNPNSTGDAPQKAQELAEELREAVPSVAIKLLETEHAGHAEELSYEAAKKGKQPLVISVSGDGGYHEVINGAMRAAEEGSDPVCAVMAAGNANDHRRMVGKRPLINAITAQDISHLDLLEVKWSDKRRFAHSYAGLGLTPVVAVELNRHTLNSLKELILIIKTYWRYQPLKIELSQKKLQLDSLVFANISGMAKVIKLSEDGKPNDGRFEVVTVPHRHKLSMVLWAVKSATVGLGKQPQAQKLTFRTLEKMPMQLDGEVVKLAARTRVQVSIAHRKLKTVR